VISTIPSLHIGLHKDNHYFVSISSTCEIHVSLSLSLTAFVTVHQHKIVAHQLCDKYCNVATAAYKEEFKNKFDVLMKHDYVIAVLVLSAARTF
jgi:hypothetical protein